EALWPVAAVGGGRVGTMPALRPTGARAITAVPPDLVAVAAVTARAVEVPHGQVFDRDVARFEDLDPVEALRARFVQAVDDHRVAVQPADVQAGGFDEHRFV